VPYFVEAIGLKGNPEASAGEPDQQEAREGSHQVIGLNGPYRSLREAHKALLGHLECQYCTPTGRILRGKTQNDRLTIVAVEGAATGFEQ